MYGQIYKAIRNKYAYISYIFSLRNLILNPVEQLNTHSTLNFSIFHLC